MDWRIKQIFNFPGRHVLRVDERWFIPLWHLLA